MSTINCPADSLKMIRETLCVAQTHVNLRVADTDRRQEHSDRLQRLIGDIDRQRPLGPDGKHGDRHTATCGCEDVASPSPASTPDTREAVSAEAIVCAGVIVGVGGESDPCVTQEQADRATRLIVRELNKYGLLRPAVATDEQAVERAKQAIRATREWQAGVAFGVPDTGLDQHAEALARAALRAAQGGGGQ